MSHDLGNERLYVNTLSRPQATARQIEATRQLPALRARKAALIERLQPLRDAESELPEAEDELLGLTPAR